MITLRFQQHRYSACGKLIGCVLKATYHTVLIRRNCDADDIQFPCPMSTSALTPCLCAAYLDRYGFVQVFGRISKWKNFVVHGKQMRIKKLIVGFRKDVNPLRRIVHIQHFSGRLGVIVSILSLREILKPCKQGMLTELQHDDNYAGQASASCSRRYQ